MRETKMKMRMRHSFAIYPTAHFPYLYLCC